MNLMADIWDTSKRSEVMSKIRSSGNQTTELRLIRIFRDNRIKGWRRRQKLLGKPDFVFPKEKICVFVDGCFWHGCPKCYRRPKSNWRYWKAKTERNRMRDLKVSRELRKAGWKVIRIWEHELGEKGRAKLIRRLSRAGLDSKA